MRKVYLNDANWKLFDERGEVVDATVPGCVHTDLRKNGKIGDMYWRDNNKSLLWIEKADWVYKCTFNAESAPGLKIVFEGLDTYSDIYLNGVFIGKSDNMFIPYEFDVEKNIINGENTLEVRFRSPVNEVKDMPQHPAAFSNERVNTRRMQCTYGWDWVDRFVTCGIYKPVYLKYAQEMYIDNIYISTDNLDSFGAQLYCEIELKNYEIGGMVYVDIISPDGDVVTGTEFYAKEPLFIRRFDIANPQLWFPYGYGEQPLYTIRVRTGKNEVSENFGIRTIKILQLDDEVGSKYYNMALEIQNGKMGQIYDNNRKFSGFKLIVNGEPIMCKGANWVPCEPFPSEEKEEKYQRLISMSRDMNLNFLRVWGGGIFENDIFYNECDKNGILVAQDFLMACGEYPEKDEWFLNTIRVEAEYAVKRLRNHPCLAWWHGDNENACYGSDTQEDYLGRNTAIKGNGPVIYKYDRMRQFLPSSPYGGNVYASITRGTSHTTNFCPQMFEFFHETDGSNFKEFFSQFVSRFIAEEPIAGMASSHTLLKTMTYDDVYTDESEEIMRFHTKNNPDFNRTVFDGARELSESYLGAFTDGFDKQFKYRFLQYEWVRVVFENIRRNIGYCNGLVFWMLEDCWPASMGWSIIDYYCQPKAGYYAFKRCARKILPSVTVENGEYVYYASNDSLSPLDYSVKAYMFDMKNGFNLCDTRSFKGSVDSYSAVSKQIGWIADDGKIVVCDTVCGDIKDRCFYKDGNLHIKASNLVTVIGKTENSITLKANGYVQAVELEGTQMFEDNYFLMLEGEERTVKFTVQDEPCDEIKINAYTI